MLSENAYSRQVTLKNVLRFAVPTIVMTVFMSFYTMVDGLFVSNLIGTDAPVSYTHLLSLHFSKLVIK